MDCSVDNQKNDKELFSRTIKELFSILNNSSVEAAEDFGIINQTFVSLEKIEKLGLNNFSLNAREYLPRKLYKYFPNKWIFANDSKKPINFSLQALINNTVHMQSPVKFDDVYDSNMNIEWDIYANIKLREYINRCNCDVDENASLDTMKRKLAEIFFEEINKSENLENVFIKPPKNEIEDLNCKLFVSSAVRELNNGRFNNWYDAIDNALYEEYCDYARYLNNVFRVSCFTTSPYQQLMWGGDYADKHTGFCIEYTVTPNFNEIDDNNGYSLYPVIYCKSRPNITEALMKSKGNNTNEWLWYIYLHGFLRKSIDWMYQNEWRLLKVFDKDTVNYNVPFYPISKVYLGCRMDSEQRNEIIAICKEKNIEYIGVTPKKTAFEMKDCSILCENCPHHLRKGMK